MHLVHTCHALTQLARVKNQLEYERSRDLKSQLTVLEQKLAKDQQKLEQSKAEEATLTQGQGSCSDAVRFALFAQSATRYCVCLRRTELKELKQQVDAKAAECKELKKELVLSSSCCDLSMDGPLVGTLRLGLSMQDGVQKKLLDLKNRVTAARKDLTAAEKEVAATEAKVEKLRTVRHQFFRECKVLQIELPILSHGKATKRKK